MIGIAFYNNPFVVPFALNNLVRVDADTCTDINLDINHISDNDIDDETSATQNAINELHTEARQIIDLKKGKLKDGDRNNRNGSNEPYLFMNNCDARQVGGLRRMPKIFPLNLETKTLIKAISIVCREMRACKKLKNDDGRRQKNNGNNVTFKRQDGGRKNNRNNRNDYLKQETINLNKLNDNLSIELEIMKKKLLKYEEDEISFNR